MQLISQSELLRRTRPWLRWGVVLLLLLGGNIASAAGFGVSLVKTQEQWVKDNQASAKHGRDALGLNFVWDHRFGSHRIMNQQPIFSYRLMVGQEKSTSGAYNGVDLEGLVFTNNLVFRLAQDDGLRFWLGPRARVVSFSAHGSQGASHYRGEVIGVGGGLVMGLDIAGRSAVGISLSAGVTRTSYWGDIDEYQSGSKLGNYATIDHRANGVFLDLALIFLTR